MRLKYPLMVCTRARGGMLSVVEAYERDGLLKRWGFRCLWTHQEGNTLTRAAIAIRAYIILLYLLATRQLSFLHVHVAMRGSFWRKSFFATTARYFGVPSILHLHGSEMKTFYESLSVLKRKLVAKSLENARAVVVLSESWREFVTKIAPKSNIHVINNYVKLPDEVPFSTNAGDFKVLFLGVLGQRKGIYDLLECWPAVIETVPGARLLVGGNGEIQLARARATNLGLTDSVEFLGWIDGAQKYELLKTADAFVLPSYNEGLPMSVLEAMSWGKPVITTRVGGIPELLSDGRDGLLIDPGDQVALTEALTALALDLSLRLRLGSAGRARIQSGYSDSVILPRLEAVYSDLAVNSQ